MKFNCGDDVVTSTNKRIAYLENWHDYFAWFPVRVGPNECRWLETVQRKCTWRGSYDGGDWDSEYRVNP